MVQRLEERPAGLQWPDSDLDLTAAESVDHRRTLTKHLLG